MQNLTFFLPKTLRCQKSHQICRSKASNFLQSFTTVESKTTGDALFSCTKMWRVTNWGRSSHLLIDAQRTEMNFFSTIVSPLRVFCWKNACHDFHFFLHICCQKKKILAFRKTLSLPSHLLVVSQWICWLSFHVALSWKLRLHFRRRTSWQQGWELRLPNNPMTMMREKWKWRKLRTSSYLIWLNPLHFKTVSAFFWKLVPAGNFRHTAIFLKSYKKCLKEAYWLFVCGRAFTVHNCNTTFQIFCLS